MNINKLKEAQELIRKEIEHALLNGQTSEHTLALSKVHNTLGNIIQALA